MKKAYESHSANLSELELTLPLENRLYIDEQVGEWRQRSTLQTSIVGQWVWTVMIVVGPPRPE